MTVQTGLLVESQKSGLVYEVLDETRDGWNVKHRPDVKEAKGLYISCNFMDYDYIENECVPYSRFQLHKQKLEV